MQSIGLTAAVAVVGLLVCLFVCLFGWLVGWLVVQVKDSCMDFANVTIRIPSTTIDLHVEARRQGSTYVLDNTKKPPTIAQLDKWHENTHPYYWSQHGSIEAEMFEGFLRGGQLDSAIRTDRAAGVADTSGRLYDFHGFTSFVRMPCHHERRRHGGVVHADQTPPNAHQFEYIWRPSSTAASGHVLWMRVRARRAFLLHVRQHNNTSSAIPSGVTITASSEWTWQRVGGLGEGIWSDSPKEFRVVLECALVESSIDEGFVDVDQLVFVPIDDPRADGVEFEPASRE